MVKVKRLGYGTNVLNPTRRAGGTGYSMCQHCKKYYTQQGISRHWDKCAMNPKNNEPQVLAQSK